MSQAKRYHTLARAAKLAGLLGLMGLGVGGVQAAPNAPAPPPMPAHAKKGFDTVVRPDGVWKKQITALHAHWFYSWGGDQPKDLPKGVAFVPMDWGYYGNKDGGLVKWLAGVKAQPGVKALLGFNEPDGKDQANLSVEGAIEGWPYLMQTGLYLGSPAAVHPDGDWMKSFMQQADAKGYRVDFVTIHWYGGNDPQGFLDMLARVHAMYGRPLWITEFAVADWGTNKDHPNRYTPAQVADFMGKVLPAMDKLPYVQRYAWFSGTEGEGALGPSALFHKGGSLTDLGKLYASL